MAKQKKSKRKIHHSTKSEEPTTSDRRKCEDEKVVDAKRLKFMLMLLFLALVLVPMAILLTSRVDAAAATEEILQPKVNDNDSADPVSKTASTSNNNQEVVASKSKTASEAVDYSKMSAWELAMHFSENYDSKGLQAQLKKTFDFNERAYNPANRKMPLHQAYKRRGGGFRSTTRHKLIHDMEQLDYYTRFDLIKDNFQGVEPFHSVMPQLYQATLDRLDMHSKAGDFDEETEYYTFQQEDLGITNYYNRAIVMPSLSLHTATLLAPRDWAKVERQWLGEDVHHPHPGIVVVDNLLSSETVRQVRNYLLASTFWYEAKLPRYGNYVGAYLNDGMNDATMTQIAYNLHKAMPRVMKNHHLKEMWSYKYESSSEEDEDSDKGRTGIHVHADDAMINVNLWMTPDDANLDPNTGGLVIYTVKPPPEWSFSNFNSNWEYIDEHLLRPSGYANVTIPYKQNRAVIFDSFLFHKSDRSRFKQGYENRRINLTFLYGKKQSLEDSEEADDVALGDNTVEGKDEL